MSEFVPAISYEQDKFSFDIVKMPFRESDTPNKMFLTTLTVDILRIWNLHNCLSYFYFRF